MKNRRGRPTGYKLSKKSKNKIRKSRIGQRHTIETRLKISFLWLLINIQL
ncbi:hypothetical protein LCGC14_2367080 [marine sediment metagenome]|uniref:Nuclease associated modular domain-containing protein n=1 Tax=marine sediment metagenome TaxID=412755 RepID=A0A0F9C4V4_9ZZZZ